MATRVKAPGSDVPSSRPVIDAPRVEATEVTGAGSEPSIILRWTVLLLLVAAGAALLPLWVPLVLAAWVALVVRPVHTRLMAKLGRGRAAGAVTVLLFVLALAPLVVIGLSLTGAAVELAHKLQGSGGFRPAFEALIASEPNLKPERFDVRRAVEIFRQHGLGAFNAASMLFGAATAAVIGVVVFLAGLYNFLVDGRRLSGWLLDHSPLPRRHMVRIGAAFVETGKGLLISVGLTALIQGVIATIGYVIIGVPQALVLGMLTVFASLIPSIGTGLVWAPVTLGLFLSGRHSAAIALLVLGLAVSVVDNVVRPILSKYGKLELHGFVVFVAMLGGIAAFGAWGLLLGPLFVRLAVEALRLWRDEHSPKLDGATLGARRPSPAGRDDH